MHIYVIYYNVTPLLWNNYTEAKADCDTGALRTTS